MEPGETPSLYDLIRRELVALPIEQWRYFFPVMVALWRFLEESRPGVLGELDAGYDDEPYFAGKGADWFTGELLENVAVLDLVEKIMYAAVDALPAAAKERGWLREAEAPRLDEETCGRLAALVLAETDRAAASRSIR